MKIKTCLFPILLLLFLTNNAQSQNLFYGITVNPGLSKAPLIMTSNENFQEEYSLSGNVGFLLEKKINSKSSLGIEALWVQLEGFGKSTNNEFVDETKSHLSYLGLPVYYRTQFGKFGINFGVQTLVFLNVNASLKNFEVVNNKLQYLGGSESNTKLDSFDIGPKVGIDFTVFESFRLRADYYHGLLDARTEEVSFKNKKQQITLGVAFVFDIGKRGNKV